MIATRGGRLGVPPEDRQSRRPAAVVASGRRRWWVHLVLIASALTSLALEPVLTVHIGLGLLFVAFVVAHLAQRRRVSLSLARRFRSVRRLAGPGGRLAMSDAVLTALTVGMLASGLWDWAAGHPTRIRWHAITGVLLAAFLGVHTLRRRTRLRRSTVR
jgi:hypothetical protein